MFYFQNIQFRGDQTRHDQTSKDFNKNEDKPNWSLLPQEDGQAATRVPTKFSLCLLQEAGQLLTVEKCNLISPEELENESALEAV